MSKLLLIGFDGMDYFMTQKTIREYSFKSIQPILKKQITKESLTGPSWASFYTGLDKDVHGVIDGWGRDTKGSNSFRDIQRYAFWNIIKKKGYKVWIDNLPITPNGFPFTTLKRKDIVNWVYKPLEGGMVHWRETIRGMSFDKMLSQVRSDSFKLIEGKRLADRDLIFIQFSFLDRIGHVFTYKEDEIMRKSYTLAYELIDRLCEIIAPQYLIVTSDHGFWKSTRGHDFANCAVAILNDKTYRFFIKNKIFKFLSITNILILVKMYRRILRNLSFSEILRYTFHCNYVKQTDFFDVIFLMFHIQYEKKVRKIEKSSVTRKASNEEKMIQEKLERLGYI